MRIESAEFVRSAFRGGDFVRDGRPEVAFVGRSNVGKSSLMNRLLGRKGLARTSSTPGRTRAVNYFLVNGWFYFVDLPGYGYAKASREERQQWAGAVDAYLSKVSEYGQLVMLVDAKVGATELDAQACGYFEDIGVRLIVVATKIDRVPKGKRQRGLGEIRKALDLDDQIRLIPFSVRSGEGVRELWREIDLYLSLRAEN